ncbi:hypothetical protein Fmac_020991 [Flemingia macrophylla]|uniref:Uncharacterized protein n=1 Tax=Flemingia macrophylla TaxID=520843 RepID=A0ABD1LVP0_9FABA
MTGLSLIPLPNSISSLNSLLLIGNHFLLGSYYKEGRGRNPCCSDENPNLCLALTLFIHVSFLNTRPTERGQCGYDIEKASDVLLDLAAPTIEKSNTDRHPNYSVDNIGDERFLADPNDSLKEMNITCLGKTHKEDWDSMKSYYRNAATAYTKGDRAYAAYLSEQFESLFNAVLPLLPSDTQQLLQQQTNMQADNEDDQQPSSAAGHYGNDY